MSKNILKRSILKLGRQTNFKYATKSLSKMKKIIDDSDIISFDMFDTLVERLVYKPTDVFDIVERKFDINFQKKSNFKQLRIQAERSIASTNDSITTLDEIYDKLENFSIEEKSYLKKFELDTEKDLIKIKSNGKVLYEYAKFKNKTCILTSDMYIPKDFIINVLNDLGYYFDDYYISGDTKVSKCNTKMFSMLKNKYQNKKIVHIGDNYYHDILNAKKYKIRTIYLLNEKKIPDNYNLDESLINSFINYKKFDSKLEEFGYKLFGPFMLGFSNFVNKNSKCDILFLSRDGYFMKKVYDTLYKNNNSKYFYASRKAFIIPKFHLDSSFENIKNSFAWGYKLSWKEFLNALNLKIELKDIDTDNIQLRDDFFSSNNEVIYNKYIRDTLQAKADEQFELLNEYWKTNISSSNVTIVDIGWRGNMQKAIESIFPDINITGLYTGILCDKPNYKGYMFDVKKTLDVFKKEVYFNLMFESLFFAPHGSTLGYKKENNEVLPVLENLSETYKHSYKLMSIIQNKCLEFINDISEYNDVLDYKYDFINPLINYLDNPSKLFLYELKDMYLENYIEFPLYKRYKGLLISKYKKIRKTLECQLYSLKMSTNKFEFYFITNLKKLMQKFKLRYTSARTIERNQFMNVLFVPHAAEIGGATKSFLTLILELKQTGIVPYVVTPNNNGYVMTFCKEHSINCYYLNYEDLTFCVPKNPIKRIIKNILKPLYYLKHKHINEKSVKQIKQIIPIDKIDLIHSNVNRDDFGIMISKKYNILNVMHLREFGTLDYQCNYLRNIYKYYNKNVDQFIAISNVIKKFYISKGIDSSKINMIYDGIDSNDIIARDYTNSSSNNNFKIMMMGYICDSKGQIQIIEALHLMSKEERNNIKISFYGSGSEEYLSYLKNKIKEYELLENFEFFEYQNNIGQIIQNYDCGFTGSHSEAFGRVTVEYMMAHLPVIASNTGANPELVIDKVDGLLYEYNNYEDLKNKILKLKYDYNYRIELANNAYKDSKRFSSDANTTGIYDLYHRMLNNN